ncbi:hypothetical protein F2Q70_00014221 [Brassica cretica]|uniref:Uncharacterized protein n=1 Tax=Brassica cretica TaxID=69181 RepID=A0A8S9HQ63_BRACR|nr:hypothetical protein F2Q70_00014221 [Brassica cretica]KAF2599667.1 hypothetical protein F2Q68_00007239 [Brassica cretica]
MERVLLGKRVARKSTFSARLGFVRSSDFEATKSSTCSSARKSKSKRSEQAPSKSSASLATAQKTPKRNDESMKSEKAAASKSRSIDISTKKRLANVMMNQQRNPRLLLLNQ